MQSSDQNPRPRPRGYAGCGGSLEVKRSMAAARLHVTTGSWGDAVRYIRGVRLHVTVVFPAVPLDCPLTTALIR